MDTRVSQIGRAHPGSGLATGEGPRLPLRKKLLYSTLATGILLLLVEGLASVFMAAREAKHVWGMREEAQCEYDEELGWVNLRGIHMEDLYGEGKSYSTNSQGFRALTDYTTTPPEGRYRITIVGDSFTMGYGVDDSETYPAQIEALAPGTQVINMGLGGYGVDQSYLWYKRDGTALRADMVIFAFIAHDFYRMRMDRFVGYSKPVLRAEGGRLSVGNVPVPNNLGTRTMSRRLTAFVGSLAVGRILSWLFGGDEPVDEYYGPVEPEVFDAAELAFDDVRGICEERGERFVLVYLPVDDLLASEPTPEFEWMDGYARSRGVTLISLTEDFGGLAPWDLPGHFRTDHHYSVLGNRFVAEALLEKLRKQFPEVPR